MLCQILRLQLLCILSIWQIQGRMDAQVVQGEVHRKAWGWGVEGGGGGMWVGGHGGGGHVGRGRLGVGGAMATLTCQAAAQTWSRYLHTPPVPSTCHWPPPGGWHSPKSPLQTAVRQTNNQFLAALPCQMLTLL